MTPPEKKSSKDVVVVVVVVVLIVGIVAIVLLLHPKKKNTSSPALLNQPPLMGTPSPATPSSGTPSSGTPPTSQSSSSTISSDGLKVVTEPLILSATSPEVQDVNYDFCKLYNMTQYSNRKEQHCYDVTWDQWHKQGKISGAPISKMMCPPNDGIPQSCSQYCTGNIFMQNGNCDNSHLNKVTLPTGVKGTAWQMWDDINNWDEETKACMSGQGKSATVLSSGGTTDLHTNNNSALLFELAPGYTCPPSPSPSPSPA